MVNGTTKRIGKIRAGDQILGPDRTSRLVIGTQSGFSRMVQVRELTENVEHVPDEWLQLVTFTCTPQQSLRLITSQFQSDHVQETRSGKSIGFRRLKRIKGTEIVVGSSSTFPGTAQGEAAALDFTRHRDKRPIYWTLPAGKHHLLSKKTKFDSYHLTVPIDFQNNRVDRYCEQAGFPRVVGRAEKVAYLFGTWVGDGCSIRPLIAIHQKDKSQIARLIHLSKQLGLSARLLDQTKRQKESGNQGGNVSITSGIKKRTNFFMNFLRLLKMGTPRSKYVPRWMRKESLSVREHFLAGLIDSDGSRRKQPRVFRTDVHGTTPHSLDKATEYRNYGGAPIATVYFSIAKGICALATSLGITYSISYQPAIGTHQASTESYFCHVLH